MSLDDVIKINLTESKNKYRKKVSRELHRKTAQLLLELYVLRKKYAGDKDIDVETIVKLVLDDNMKAKCVKREESIGGRKHA